MEIAKSERPSLWRSLETLPELDIVYDPEKSFVYKGHLECVLQNPARGIVEGKITIEAPKMIYFCVGNFKYYDERTFRNSLTTFFQFIFQDIMEMAVHFNIQPLIENLKRKDLLEINIPMKKDVDTGYRKNIGIAYVFINDPLVTALVLGYNINGSKRIDIVEDPNWNSPTAITRRNICREGLVKMIASLEEQMTQLAPTKKEVDFASINWGDYQDEEDEEFIKSRQSKLESDLKSAQEQLLKLEISTIEQVAQPLIELPIVIDRNQSGLPIKPIIKNMLLKFSPDNLQEFTLLCRLKNFDSTPITFKLRSFYNKFARYSNHPGYPRILFVPVRGQTVVTITFAPDKHDAIAAFEMNLIFPAFWNPDVNLMLNRVTDTEIDEILFKVSQQETPPDGVISSLDTKIEIRKHVQEREVLSSRGRFDNRGGPTKWREPRTQEVDSDGFEMVSARAKTRGRGK